jgi:calcineurin-like phosphoesterase family protein
VQRYTADGNGVEPDPRYFNACVEAIDYRPIELNDLIKRFRP